MHYLGGAADGQTPLEPDEAAQLLRPAVTTLAELDIVEQTVKVVVDEILQGSRSSLQRLVVLVHSPLTISIARFSASSFCFARCSKSNASA